MKIELSGEENLSCTCDVMEHRNGCDDQECPLQVYAPHTATGTSVHDDSEKGLSVVLNMDGSCYHNDADINLSHCLTPDEATELAESILETVEEVEDRQQDLAEHFGSHKPEPSTTPPLDDQLERSDEYQEDVRWGMEADE